MIRMTLQVAKVKPIMMNLGVTNKARIPDLEGLWQCDFRIWTRSYIDDDNHNGKSIMNVKDV